MCRKILRLIILCFLKWLHLCQDESVIGCDFYVMKRIEGIIPRAKLPPELGLMKKMFMSFV
jgi:aminoglycoside phosphotransferase (APT) family kinase protein